ncbi:MAG: CocE/NonD family hydrolase [Bacteroidia bacterium]|nr:CocE/NonD family hydrolase [Bacteroidia bacterium]
MRKLYYSVLIIFGTSYVALSQIGGPVIPNNGKVEGIEELIERKEYMVPMKDGVRLATDVFRPILQDDLSFETPLTVAGFNLGNINLTVAQKGTQFYKNLTQSNSNQLSIVFTRTPYGKNDPLQGQIEALMGYCGVVQDMRGRYRSEGTYLPMFSDSWAKKNYFADSSMRHPMDITPNANANFHEDGLESIDYLTYNLRYDSNRDSVINDSDDLICNGNIGMLGASALGNSQYQAAAVKKINTQNPGLKCLLPIVASGEFYHSTGHQNGVYRERIIDGWLRGQVERYDWQNDSTDNDPNNSVHTLRDYGPSITTPLSAAEMAIDFWTTMYRTHYPDAEGRAVMDVSHAYIDSAGNATKHGTISRYTNFELPIYHLSGWWDIFTDGQIETYQRVMQNVSTKNKNLQKLVIGPWAHQTIGSRTTGDVTYPEVVGSLLGATLDNISAADIPSVGKSEIIAWFRKFLGEPTVELPPYPVWQPIQTVLGTLYIQVPADTFHIPFTQFFNFINGAGPLQNLPIKIKGIALVDSSQTQYITIPATGTSLIGDPTHSAIPDPANVEWDRSKPNGVPNVRLYVVGPVEDGVSGQNGNPATGNYWMSADTFPIKNVQNKTFYLHADQTLDLKSPTTDEGNLSYTNDPNNPVRTHGGNNMIVYTTDGSRVSQGQMNLADTRYASYTMNRPDVLQFTSPDIRDSLSIIGYPVVTLYAKSLPIDVNNMDVTNCDFIVRVIDVCPDGRELFVNEGAVNARARLYAASYSNDTYGTENLPWSNIKVDSIYEFRFKMLPLAYTFGKGHRMKVLISSSSWPRYQSCPQIPLMDGEFYRRRPMEEKYYVYNGQQLIGRSAVQTIAFSNTMPTQIIFPIYGGDLVSANDNLVADQTHTSPIIYPNPANDIIHISTPEENISQTVEIQNIMGVTLLKREFQGYVNISVSDLPRGLYLVRIKAANREQSITQKIILK